jgi:hypothetical protein
MINLMAYLASEAIYSSANRAPKFIDIIFKNAPASAVRSFAMECIPYLVFSLSYRFCQMLFIDVCRN